MLNGGFQSLDGMKTRIYGSSGGGDIWDKIPGMCFLHTASDSSSFSGTGQTWANLVPSPADGSSKTDYDFYRGDTATPTTDDPTFNGTAGTPGAYWSFDGGDFFRIITSTVPTLLKSAHKTSSGNTSWIAWAGRIAGTGTNALFSQIGTTNFNGIELIKLNSAGSHNFALVGRHPTYNAWFGQTTSAKTANEDFCIVAGYQRSGSTDIVKLWYNSRTADTPTVTVGGTTTNDAAQRATCGARSTTTSLQVANGSRCYGMAGGSDLMDNTLAGYVFDYFNSQTGLVFA